MKALQSSLRKLLLLTSVVLSPSVATAQETQTTTQPPAEDAAPAVEEEGEIVVRGRNIPEPMRETSEVATFLSAADLERQGDDTAAAALTRLTGLSVVSGRFVFVRGLGDRYSSALLNGSPLPSPEPLRRTVPLDLFPSNILNGAAVQKTFSPNYPGEFGGGIIDLKTLSTPNAPFLTLKASSSFNTETTAQEGLFYYGGDRDWTGYDDGIRDIPGPLAAAIGRNRRIQDSNFTAGELEVIGESLVNSPLTVIQTGDTSPNTEFEATGGISFDRGIFNIGLIGVAGYDSSWTTQIAERGLAARDTIATDFESFTTSWDVTANALGGVSLGWGENEIKLTTLYVHNTSKEAQFVEGFDFNLIGNQGFTESTAWYERELASLQIAGKHEIGGFELGWRGALAQSTRDAPYERSVSRQVDTTTGQAFYGIGNANSTRFSELKDEVDSFGGDFSYTMALSEQRDLVISGGIDHTNTVRNYSLYQFVFGGSLNLLTEADVASARVDFLFSPDNINAQRFELFELTGPDDTYKGNLWVNAGFLSVDAEIIPLVRAAVGFRYEESSQTVRTFNRFGDPTTPGVQIDSDYILPAATLTWNFAEDMQLRLGYSQTIARPQFRELAISPYIDPETDRTYRGNPGLENSEIQNFDARFEFYFGRNRFITAGAFFKEIEKPIEEVITETSLFNFATRFINAPKATVQGIELEYRTKFEMPFELALLKDKDWLFAVNYTYTKSEVEAGAGDTVVDPLTGTALPASAFALDGAQLQGTPEHIANLQLGYETDNSQMTLLVGYVDTRILQRGFGNGLPDIQEDPGINLDLVYRREFSIGQQPFTFGLSGRNLLDEAHEEFQQGQLGRTEVNTYDRGRNFSISLTAKY